MLLRYCEVIIFKIKVQLPIVSFGLEAFLTKLSWVGFFTHRKTIRNCNFTLRYICLHPTRRVVGKKVRGGGERGDPAFSNRRGAKVLFYFRLIKFIRGPFVLLIFARSWILTADLE